MVYTYKKEHLHCLTMQQQQPVPLPHPKKVRIKGDTVAVQASALVPFFKKKKVFSALKTVQNHPFNLSFKTWWRSHAIAKPCIALLNLTVPAPFRTNLKVNLAVNQFLNREQSENMLGFAARSKGTFRREWDLGWAKKHPNGWRWLILSYKIHQDCKLL